MGRRDETDGAWRGLERVLQERSAQLENAPRDDVAAVMPWKVMLPPPFVNAPTVHGADARATTSAVASLGSALAELAHAEAERDRSAVRSRRHTHEAIDHVADALKSLLRSRPPGCS